MTLGLLLLGLDVHKRTLDSVNIAKHEQPPARHFHAGLWCLAHACLRCSQPSPEECHRRLVAEYLRGKYSGSAAIEIVHL